MSLIAFFTMFFNPQIGIGESAVCEMQPDVWQAVEIVEVAVDPHETWVKVRYGDGTFEVTWLKACRLL